MFLRALRREDLPAVLALSEGLFPQIDPRRAGIERVFDNPNALALAAVDGGGTDGEGEGAIVGFVVAIVGDAQPGGAPDGGSTAAHDYEQIRRLVVEQAAVAASADEDDSMRAALPPSPPPPPSTAAAAPTPLMSVSIRSARAGGPVRVGCVALLGVAPQHRRKGLARRLMRSAAAFCASLGAAALYLHTPAGNASAVALYEGKLGFVRAAFLPGYYSRSRDGGDEDAVAEGGGKDAFLFVRPLFGAAAAVAVAPPAAPPTPTPAAEAAPSAARALPPLLQLPFWARRADDRPAAAAPPAGPGGGGVAFRVDAATGEVALVDEEEEEEAGEDDDGQQPSVAPVPQPPLLQRLASAFPLPRGRAAGGGPPPARAVAGRRGLPPPPPPRRRAMRPLAPPAAPRLVLLLI